MIRPATLGAMVLTVALLACPPVRAEDPPRPRIVIDETSPDLRNVIPSQIWAVAFSPDGSTLAACAGTIERGEPGELVMWDIASGREVLLRRQDIAIRTVAFAPQGKLAAIGDFAGQTRLLDPTTGKIVATLEDHDAFVNSVAFTPDGASLAAGSFDGTVKLFDVATHEKQAEFSAPGEMFITVDISRDGGHLAAVTRQGKAHVWNLPRREKLHTLQASNGQPDLMGTAEEVAFSPDAAPFATGSWDNMLRIWSTPTAEVQRDLAGHNSPIVGMVWSPDGSTLVTSDAEGRVFLWNVDSGERVASWKAHASYCFGLAFSPDGKQLATSGFDGLVRIWDWETREAVKTYSRLIL